MWKVLGAILIVVVNAAICVLYLEGVPIVALGYFLYALFCLSNGWWWPKESDRQIAYGWLPFGAEKTPVHVAPAIVALGEKKQAVHVVSMPDEKL
jgi:hypothetical protein